MLHDAPRAALSKAVISFWKYLDPPSWIQNPKPSSDFSQCEGLQLNRELWQTSNSQMRKCNSCFMTGTYPTDTSRLQHLGAYSSSWPEGNLHKSPQRLKKYMYLRHWGQQHGKQVCNCSSGEFTALQGELETPGIIIAWLCTNSWKAAVESISLIYGCTTSSLLAQCKIALFTVKPKNNCFFFPISKQNTCLILQIFTLKKCLWPLQEVFSAFYSLNIVIRLHKL